MTKDHLFANCLTETYIDFIYRLLTETYSLRLEDCLDREVFKMTKENSATSSFESLPLSVLELICDLLVHCEPKRRSLYAFSLTCKYFCSAAMRKRFQRVHFTVLNRNKLLQDVKRWKEILDIDDRANYVRAVKVVGYMRLIQEDEADEEKEVVSTFSSKVSAEDDDGEGEAKEDDFYIPSKAFFREVNIPSPRVTRNEEEERNKGWLPLAGFFEQLPYLQDLIYACTHQIPICILTSLHQYHPNSHLHVHTFNLRSLCHPKSHPQDIDPNEYALVTSPCLYAIVVSYAEYDSDGRVDYNEEAVLQMMATTSPRLNYVHMWYSRPAASPALYIACETPRPPWQGFFVDQPGDSSTLGWSNGGLQHLVLDGGNTTNTSTLTAWSNRTKFSLLHSLGLQNDVRLEALRTLTQITEDGELKSLRTLALSLRCTWHGEQDHMDEAASLMLQALHPLEKLSLDGFVANRTFTSILDRHGETLRKLRFIPSRRHDTRMKPYIISDGCIQELAKQCPNLQEIELLISRTRGDQQEVSIYHALSRLRRVEQISLCLDCSQLTEVSEDNFWLGDDPQAASRMRENLANGAVNMSLALAIFGAISTTTTSSNTTRLRNLKLQPVGSEDLGRRGIFDLDFSFMVRQVARSWICTRVSGAGGEEIIAKEIGKHDRMEYQKYLDQIRNEKPYRQVWEDLWPKEKEATGNWWDKWSSFPLFSVKGKEK